MISTLLDIVQGSRELFKDNVLTVSDIRCPNHNYTIYSLDCNLLFGSSIFAEISWNPVEYIDEIETEINLLGEEIRFYHKKTGTLSFNAIVNEDLLHEIQLITMNHVQQMRDLETNVIYDIFQLSVEVTSTTDVIVATISFKVLGADEITTACCGSLYDGAPFEPCDPDGTPPDPPTECIGFAVGITAALPILTGTSSGGPGGIATYQWFFDANNDGNFETLVSETAQTLNITLPGTYRVQVTQGGCSGTSDFLYNDPCAGYAVLLTFEGGLLIAEPNFPVTAYAWYEPGDILDPGDTDNVYVPTQSGLHTVRITTTACGVIEASLNVTLGESCGSFTYDLVRVNDELQIQNLGPCAGTVSYQWLLDNGDGNGFVIIPGALASTLTISETGLYRSNVSCDNPICSLVKDILVLDNCVLFKAFISTIIPGTGGVDFTAASTNAPPGVVVNYTWYEWISENWQLLGTGMTLFITDTADPANVRLIATAGTCTREDFTHDCVDPSMIEPYQAFATVLPNTVEFVVTSFTFVQPDDQGGSLTINQIGAKYLVTRNGLVQKYVVLTDITTTNEQNTYSYDFVNNKLLFPTNNPLFVGDRATITDTQPTTS